MIPTLLLAGLIVGRWWFVFVAGVVWAALVHVDAVAFGVGAANAAVGVAVHRAAVVLVRRLRGFLQGAIGSLGA